MTSLVQKILFDSDRDKFAMTQNARERCCWHSNIWPTGWFTPHQSIIKLQRHTEVYEETFDVNIKIAQTTQNSWNFNIVGKSSLLKWRKCKLRRLLGRLRTLILRPRDAVQNLQDYPGELSALTIFTSPGDGNRHFTCSSKPLEGPAACNAKGVP